MCRADDGKTQMTRDELKGHNVTIRDFDGDHWLMLVPGVADKFNYELAEWIEGVVVPSCARLSKL